MRVLIAEDDTMSRFILRAAVEQFGHECLIAADGQEAWELFQTTPIDVVVSDWLMPGITGLELCQRIRAHAAPLYTYFIFLTALGERGDILVGIEAGADAYFAKPLVMDELQVGLLVAARVIALHRRLAAENLEALREREAYLRLALKSSGMTAWDWEVATDTLTFAAETQAGSGSTPTRVDAFLARLDPRDRPMMKEAMRRSLDECEPFHIEFRMPRADGGVRWRVGHGQMLCNAAGRPVRLIGLAEDITARKQVEQALLEAKEAAEQANAAKSEFLSRLSHELRTPLNAILGFGHLLESEPLTTEQQESVAYVVEGGHHLLQLVNEVLDVTQLEQGTLRGQVEAVPITEVVETVCRLVSPLATARGIQLIAVCDVPCIVEVDRQRLQQVLLSLLNNAIIYNRPEGRVTISYIARPGSRLRIMVEDTGPGIAEADLPKLFLPFERLQSHQSESEGTGLGLAHSKAVITAMAGTIGVDSVIGVGSSFWIELPGHVS